MEKWWEVKFRKKAKWRERKRPIFEGTKEEKWRTSDARLVNGVVVAETSNNLVLDAEDELELVVAALLEDNGGLLELSQRFGLVEVLEDYISIRAVLEDDVHLYDDDTTGVVLGCNGVRAQRRKERREREERNGVAVVADKKLQLQRFKANR